MKEFRDKVAVITGGASGIGLGLAERFAREGMKIVLADVEENALAQAERDLKAAGAEVTAVVTDVSKSGDVEALAKRTLETYGAVHLLCNNAGVSVRSTIWESTLSDWQWVLGVNLWGVIHGVRTFVPIMLQQTAESHIVNTASLAGLVSFPGIGIYKVTKFGVVSLSETLYHELKNRGANIKVSVLCPSFVKSRFSDSERNRPAELLNDHQEELSPEAEKRRLAWRQGTTQNGMTPEQVADCVIKGIREERFYIFTDTAEAQAQVRLRMEDILQGRNPTDVMARTGLT
jgi:NAD(P)-dependent dehydrogenase (short-subunit alcohol dehydrogenase family)